MTRRERRDGASPSLAELQRWMRWIITDPRGAAAALEDPHPAEGTRTPRERYVAPSPDCRQWIQGDPESSTASVVSRLDVYAEAYFLRIVQALSRDFRRTHHVLGPEAFARWMAEYLKVWPSRSWNINEVGAHLSEFMREQSDSAALAALVDLEWQGLQCFFGPLGNLVGDCAVGAALGDVVHSLSDDAESGNSEDELIVNVVPGFRLLESPWPLDAWWRELDGDSRQDPGIQEPEAADPARDMFCSLSRSLGCPPLLPQQSYGMWRRPGATAGAWDVMVRRFEPLESCVAQRLMAGDALGAALDAAIKAVGADAVSEEEVSALFARWTEEGVIAGISGR